VVDTLQNAASVPGNGFVNHHAGDRSDAGPVSLDYFSGPVDFALESSCTVSRISARDHVLMALTSSRPTPNRFGDNLISACANVTPTVC
jgi:hypothetical protein